MRCVSLSVGVTNYIEKRYRESGMRLVHAATDAEALHRYASAAWEDGTHLKLLEREATLSSLEAAFTRLSRLASLDLFLLYLSGHGERSKNENDGWFCLADAREGEPSLDRPLLDRLLLSIPASRVLLLIDCCYAESITSGLTFFNALDFSPRNPLKKALTRVYIAAARADQRAWEDHELKRSILSDVLLRALSTVSDVADSQGQVDLDTRLLPYLREQIPLNAALRKAGNVQEPVIGGLSVAATKLPIVTMQSLGRELSVAETVRHGVQRAVRLGLIFIVLTLAIIDQVAYHVVPSGTGELLVRSGLKYTYSILPFHLRPEVDSGLTISDIQPANDALLRVLANGSVQGLANHYDENTLRPWLAALQPGLLRARRLSVMSFTTGQADAFNPDDDPPPTIEIGFLAKLLNQSRFDVAAKVYPLDQRSDASCEKPAGLTLDFSILENNLRVFQRDAAFLAASAPKQGAARARVLSELIRLAAYRTSHTKDSETLEGEFDAFARAVQSIIHDATSLNGTESTTFAHDAASLLADLTQGWCREHALFALAFLRSEDRGKNERYFFNVFRESYKPDGPRAEMSQLQQLAALALENMARVDPLRADILEQINILVLADGADFSKVTPSITLVKRLARVQPLPETLIAQLLQQMGKPAEEGDFSSLTAFNLLATNSSFLEPQVLKRVQSWAEARANSERTMSIYHEGLGHLALHLHDKGLSNLGELPLAVLVANLSPETRFSPRAFNYRGADVITHSGDAAAVALGRVLQTGRSLPEDVVERLLNVAIGRPDLAERSEIIHGLTSIWYRTLRSEDLADVITARLTGEQSNAARRAIEIEVAADYLAGFDANARSLVISSILDQWRASSEPEVRIGLARVVGLSETAIVGR